MYAEIVWNQRILFITRHLTRFYSALRDKENLGYVRLQPQDSETN